MVKDESEAVDYFSYIQDMLDNIKNLHREEIDEYSRALKHSEDISNNQTMEIQRLNTLLYRYEYEIRRLRGEKYQDG